MAPFLRIAFNAYDLGALSPLTEAPFCAVKMKEALSTGKGLSFFLIIILSACIILSSFVLMAPITLCLAIDRGKTLIQKKPTMFPAWRSSFDAHIYEGRVLQVLLMRTAEDPLAEMTVGVSVLAERCKKANGRAEFWVCDSWCAYMHLFACVSVCLC